MKIELTRTEIAIARDAVAREYNRVLRRGRRGTERPSVAAVHLAELQRVLNKLPEDT